MAKPHPSLPDFSDSDLYKEAPIGFFLSEAHKENLRRLEQIVRRERQSVIVVSGPPGFGKTVLVRQFAVNLQSFEKKTFRFEWLNLSELRIPGESIDALISQIRREKSNTRVIIVLDEVERVSQPQIQFLVGRLLNWKRVQSVIITTILEDLRIPRAHHIIISPPDGKLYGLREQVIFPNRAILSSLAPLVVSTNDALIEKLKREPSGLYKISPRQFEEVIADLLANMGMEVELTPETHDGGKDILAYMNTELGRFLTLVEAKQHNKSRPVGVSLVRSLFGTLVDHQATSGMLVTTSRFAKPAKQFQERHKYQLNLKEYEDVVTWLLQYRRK